MDKNIYFPFVLLLGLFFVFTSCVDSDDNNPVDEEWMLRNIREFNEESSNPDYKKLVGESDPSTFILWKKSTRFENSNENSGEIISPKEFSPVFSDTVMCRYEGWFKDALGNKVIFDSTEGGTSFDQTDPNRVPRTFIVGGLTEGWRVALYNMKEGDEWSIVVPFHLAYGILGSGYIPRCTNLYFDIKLIEIFRK